MVDRVQGTAAPASGDHRQALPRGQALGPYRIESVLGASAFAITYLALDPKANRRVVIKEYRPDDIVTRDGTALRGATAEDADLLRRGRDRFLSDGKRLQRVKHASIVRVLDAFEANSTGYLVFEHEAGATLAATLAGTHTLNDEPMLRRFAAALLDALDAVHQAAFLHGRIEPGNIRLRADGTPVLLDFGAARAATGLARHASRVPLAAGYAAIEQYTSQEAQGPWTDLYGLAAVLYRVVTGKEPLDAPARLLEERLVPASDAGSGRFSRAFLKAIDAALVVRPEDRPQTVAEWRPMLDRPLAPQAAASRDPATADDEEDDYMPPLSAANETSRTWIYATAGVVGVVILGTLALAGIGYMANQNDLRRNSAGGVLATQNAARAPVEPRGNPAVMPLPAGPADDVIVREARQREQEQRLAALEEQRTRELRQQQARADQARGEQQERQAQQARQVEEQKRREAAAQQEQARQAQLRQEQARAEQAKAEQAKAEQERQAAAARAAEEARQREAAARQEQQQRQEAARQEQARQEAARQEQARQEAARQEAARQEQARQEQVRQEQERQAAATRLAEELRQRDLARQQQEQITAARTLEEARVREQAQARAPSETERAATTTGSAMLLPPPAATAAPAAPFAVRPPASQPPAETARAAGAPPVPLTGPVVLTPPPQQQMARASVPPLAQPPALRPEQTVAGAPAARAAIDVGRIDAVNWQWGYVVMQMEQRQGMQVGDRVYARSGDAKLWMTVRRVNGTQVSAVPDSDLQRYAVNGRIYKE